MTITRADLVNRDKLIYVQTPYDPTNASNYGETGKLLFGTVAGAGGSNAGETFVFITTTPTQTVNKLTKMFPVGSEISIIPFHDIDKVEAAVNKAKEEAKPKKNPAKLTTQQRAAKKQAAKSIPDSSGGGMPAL